MEVTPHTALAGQRLQPLGHLSTLRIPLPRQLAVGVGFEPTELSFNGFQDRRLQPLGHPTRLDTASEWP
jgi:hypothetical protein